MCQYLTLIVVFAVLSSSSSSWALHIWKFCFLEVLNTVSASESFVRYGSSADHDVFHWDQWSFLKSSSAEGLKVSPGGSIFQKRYFKLSVSMLVLLWYWWFAKNQNQFFRFLFKWKEPTSFLCGDFINGVKQPHKMYNMVEWGNRSQKLSQYSLVDRNHTTWVEISASTASIDFSTYAHFLGHLTLLLLNIPVQFWSIAAGWMSVGGATRISNLSFEHVEGCLLFSRLPTSKSYFFLQLPIQLMHESLK